MEYNKLFVEWQIGRHLLPTPSQRSLVVVVDFFLVSNIFSCIVHGLVFLFIVYDLFFFLCMIFFFLLFMIFLLLLVHKLFLFFLLLILVHDFFFFVLSTIFLFLFIWLFIIFSSCSQGLLSPCWQSFILLLLIVIHDLYFFLFMNFFLSFHDLLFFPPLPLESILVFVWIMYHVLLLSQQINNVYKHMENYLWPWFCICEWACIHTKVSCVVLPPTTLPLEHSHLQWQCHQ